MSVLEDDSLPFTLDCGLLGRNLNQFNQWASQGAKRGGSGVVTRSGQMSARRFDARLVS